MDTETLRTLRQAVIFISAGTMAFLLLSGLSSIEPIRIWATTNEGPARIFAALMMVVTGLGAVAAVAFAKWLTARKQETRRTSQHTETARRYPSRTD